VETLSLGTEITVMTQNDVAVGTPLGEKLLGLNNAHAQSLSWLEPERLCHLVKAAFFAGRVGEADGLLIAFDQDADYDSPNFLWFRDRFPRFVYVDRVVVAAAARGRGIAKTLYFELFRQAGNAGHDKIVCEINKTPPNPESDEFHAALGFTEIGSGLVDGGRKTVRYMARQLSSETR
jgi:predicted GNAT superfamily acetyltransferase